MIYTIRQIFLDVTMFNGNNNTQLNKEKYFLTMELLKRIHLKINKHITTKLDMKCQKEKRRSGLLLLLIHENTIVTIEFG